jgi:hypothetical protein
MKIWNLTPHEIHYENTNDSRSISSDGIARAIQMDTASGSIAGLMMIQRRYSGVENMPDEITEGDVLIVSTILAECLISTRDEKWEKVVILVPDTGPSCRRNSDGTVASVSQFILKIGHE